LTLLRGVATFPPARALRRGDRVVLEKLGWKPRAARHSAAASREVAEAERRLRGRGARDPDNWRALARACVAVRDADGAYAALRRVADLAPDDPAAAFECGVAARKAGKVPEALDWFSRCLALDPDDAKSHTQYAKALDLAGLLDEALRHHRRALELAPGSAEAHYHLGVTLARHGRDDEALGAYLKTLEMDESFARAHGNLGVLLDRRGEFDRAVEELRRAVALEPNRAEWH